MSELDREVLFRNEAFTIGVLQAVSGASAAGAISQFDGLTRLADRIPVLVFITLMVATLVCAVLAAYFRHQYKMWDVKAGAPRGQGEQELAETRDAWATRDLARMRHGMTVAVAILCLGFLELVAALWWGIVVEWVCQ